MFPPAHPPPGDVPALSPSIWTSLGPSSGLTSPLLLHWSPESGCCCSSRLKNLAGGVGVLEGCAGCAAAHAAKIREICAAVASSSRKLAGMQASTRKAMQLHGI
jgi:hypothetical protein